MGIPMREAIDEIVGELFTPLRDTGLIVGVTERGRSSVFGWGEKQGVGSGPPGGDTLFEIGSVTKVFTTSLLSLLASKGTVSLDDPVHDVFSTLPGMPPEITVLRLATHTSGLPKIPPDALWTTLTNRSNPYADYTTARLMEYLSNYRRKPRPDEEISYSNMGMALLGHILAEKAGGTYEEAVISMICDELGMPDTRITLTSEQEERLATPHSGGGSPSHGWDLPAFAGAGALRSTANDILRFLDAHMGRPASPFTGALTLSHEKRTGRFPTPGSLMRLFPGASRRRHAVSSFTQSIGLGWMIGTAGEAGPEAHWHHGATGGYMVFVGFIGEAGAGTVVMVNRGPRLPEMIGGVSSTDEIGFRVLKSLCSAD
jgi:CubicO group peptidase (beta-lactamase class C family)